MREQSQRHERETVKRQRDNQEAERPSRGGETVKRRRDSQEAEKQSRGRETVKRQRDSLRGRETVKWQRDSQEAERQTRGRTPLSLIAARIHPSIHHLRTMWQLLWWWRH